MKTMFAAVLAGAVLTGAAAQAGPLPPGGVTRAEVTAALTARGLPAALKADGAGEQLIASKVGDTPFVIIFYGCSKAQRCQSVMFKTAYHFDGGVSAAKVNEWNRYKRFIRAWLDPDQDPNAVMDVDFETGATSEAIGSNLDTWLGILPVFRAHFQ
jgi:hypothetical protein